MEVSKVIYGRIGPRGTYTVGEITEEDYGAVFQMPDLDLPAAYNVDFSNNPHAGTALTVIGNEDGAEIPKELIDTGRDVYAYLYWVGDGFGKTTYTFKIRNNRRPKRGHPAPTPTQQSVIDQTISALNTAVGQAEAAKEMLENVSAAAFSLPEGAAPVATYSNGLFTFGIPAGGGEGGGGGGEYVGLAVVNGQLCVSYDG